jgi:hypothetical protein
MSRRLMNKTVAVKGAFSANSHVSEEAVFKSEIVIEAF